jgi:hypothetical protein
MAKRFVLAAGLLLLAACGSDQAAPGQEPSGSMIAATTEPAPTSRNIITEGVIDKRVGQPGGLGCGEGADAVCDVVFTVTALDQDTKCAGVATSTGMRLLRIEIDAEAAATYQHDQPPTALELTHWDVETDDGSRHRLQMVGACSPDPGVFAEPLAAGAHSRDSVVVEAPKRATFIWLQYLQTTWRWSVRAPM